VLSTAFSDINQVLVSACGVCQSRLQWLDTYRKHEMYFRVPCTGRWLSLKYLGLWQQALMTLVPVQSSYDPFQKSHASSNWHRHRYRSFQSMSNSVIYPWTACLNANLSCFRWSEDEKVVWSKTGNNAFRVSHCSIQIPHIFSIESTNLL
jgi:hypothetical protein